jgi:AraC-like DNA-binding protein
LHAVKVNRMLMNRTALALASPARVAEPSGPPQSAAWAAMNVHHLPVRGRDEASNRTGRQNGRTVTAAQPSIDIWPREIANRQAKRSAAMAVETVQMSRRERIDIRFRAPVHLLVIVEQGVRVAGETSVEGLPCSRLRDLRRKLSFVPAGHDYHEWQEPSLLPRATYFYFDPAKLPLDLTPGQLETLRTPRLFFEDAALWETGLKLRRLLEEPGIDSQLCFEALGIILAHELVRTTVKSHRTAPPARGGLAAWQQRILIDHIEGNLAERISLAKLAELVRLSPYYFCRAFKESFGVPPHRYHANRRIERAKDLLTKPDYSVTDIGMSVGFSDTSSFSTAFRKATGLTPTAYHRTRS